LLLSKPQVSCYTLFCGGTIHIAAHAAAKQNVFAKANVPSRFSTMPTVKVFKQTMSARRALGKMRTFVHLSASPGSSKV
jgi:hypothetical protein